MLTALPYQRCRDTVVHEQAPGYHPAGRTKPGYSFPPMRNVDATKKNTRNIPYRDVVGSQCKEPRLNVYRN